MTSIHLHLPLRGAVRVTKDGSLSEAAEEIQKQNKQKASELAAKVKAGKIATYEAEVIARGGGFLSEFKSLLTRDISMKVLG